MSSIGLVILETMWGPADGFKKLFCINPNNVSGRRLYRIMDRRFYVGNCCDGIVEKATLHGTPNPDYLSSVFTEAFSRTVTPSLIVIGGKIAKSTWQLLHDKPEVRTVFIPHPAARFWTKGLETQAKEGIPYRDREVLTREGWVGN